jgi:hypothetical protein
MTHSDFNHLLSSIKALSPEQMRQLRRRLDSELAHLKQPTAQTPAKRTDRAKARASPPPKKPLTIKELHQQMMAEGLITRLLDTAADFDDPDDQPITIKGEPLSETIILERR